MADSPESMTQSVPSRIALATPPILKAYLSRAVGGRPHIPVDPEAPLEAFERIAPDFPVFRIDPVGPTSR